MNIIFMENGGKMILFEKIPGFPDGIKTIKIFDDNIDESIEYINDNKIESAKTSSRQIEKQLKDVEELPENDSVKLIGEI